jgi:hypothetical protein
MIKSNRLFSNKITKQIEYRQQHNLTEQQNIAQPSTFESCLPLTSFQAKQLSLLQPNKHVISMSNVIKAMKTTNFSSINHKPAASSVLASKSAGFAKKSTAQSSLISHNNLRSRTIQLQDKLGSGGSLPIEKDQFLSGSLPTQNGNSVVGSVAFVNIMNGE